MIFRRFLSSEAVARVKQRWGGVLAAWVRTPGATVNLRRFDEVAFYYLGQKALWIGSAGADEPVVHTWDEQVLVGHDSAVVQAALALAQERIDAHVRWTEADESELAAQGRLLQRTFNPDTEFLLVDEQIRIPAEAVDGEPLAHPRADALVIHRATGDLWL